MAKIKQDQIRLYQGGQYAFLIDMKNEKVVRIAGKDTVTAKQWRAVFPLPSKMEKRLVREVATLYIESQSAKAAGVS